MPVNWKAEDAYTRLLAAIVAANDLKLDYRKIATMYGNGKSYPLLPPLSHPQPVLTPSLGATYDSIEGRFRVIRKEAAILKAEIESGARPSAPPRNANCDSSTTTPKKSKSTANTPKKEKTLTGRVTKSGVVTPTKKGANGKSVKEIKTEPDNGASSFCMLDEGEEDAEGVDLFDGNAYFEMEEGI